MRIHTNSDSEIDTIPTYKIDSLSEFLRLSTIDEIHLDVKSRLQGKIRFKNQTIWFPINQEEPLYGWLEHHSPNNCFMFDNIVYTREEFEHIYRLLPQSLGIYDYYVNIEIDYDKIIEELRSLRYPKHKRFLMIDERQVRRLMRL